MTSIGRWPIFCVIIVASGFNGVIPNYTRRFTDEWSYIWLCRVLFTQVGQMIPSSMWDHYIDVIMTTLASQITSLTVVYSIVHSDPDQRKHQSFASLAIVWGIHRTGEFPEQRASNTESVSISWRHHVSGALRQVINTYVNIYWYVPIELS